MEQLTDESLVRAIRRGNMKAFDELYRRYANRLFSFLLRHLGSRAEAEDVLQEVFMTVLKNDALELRDGKFCAWLFRVARNRAVGSHRSEARRSAQLHEVEPPESAASPEAAAGTREALSQVERAMGTLSEAHAEVLMLKVVGGLTYRQIAEVQEVAEGTAKSRLHFAIRSVRRFLKTDEEGLSHES